MVLTALLSSLLALLVLAPGAFALSGDDQYGAGFTGDDPRGGGGGGGSDGSGSAPGGGSGSGSSGSGSSPGGGSGSDGGSGSGSSGGSGLDSASGAGGSGGFDSSGEAFADAGGKKGRSVGELLSGTGGPTNPAATTDAGTRAAQRVGENSGISGLVWLLLALGAITAVAGGGVAVRRRQARAGF